MKRIREKIRSDKGASITFALLIFLVCAVISSVVLVAATTVTGRISKEAESDQRYYSVTSAAELLKGIIDNKPVSIIEEEEETAVTTYDRSNQVSSVSDPVMVDSLYVVDKAADEITESDKTSNEVSGDAPWPTLSIQKYAAYDYYQYSTAVDPAIVEKTMTRTFKLTSDIGKKDGDEGGPLDVTVSEKLDRTTGNFSLTIFNASGDPYKIVMTFESEVKKSTEVRTEEGTPVPGPSGSYTVETTKTTSEITMLTWHLTDMKTLQA